MPLTEKESKREQEDDYERSVAWMPMMWQAPRIDKQGAAWLRGFYAAVQRGLTNLVTVLSKRCLPSLRKMLLELTPSRIIAQLPHLGAFFLAPICKKLKIDPLTIYRYALFRLERRSGGHCSR